MRLLTGTLALGALLAISGMAQTAGDGYLDYYIVKVKPEKRADFDAIAKQIVEANRKNDGDKWLTYQTDYGENDTVYFVSRRENLGAIDTAATAFMKAMKESFGPAAESMLQDMDKCAISSRGEIRRRRVDLSVNMPRDPAEYEKQVGAARWIMTTAYRIRPGHVSQFEELAHMVKSAAEKQNNSAVVSIAQSVAGTPGMYFYVTRLTPSLGDLDSQVLSVKQILGADFPKWEQGIGEATLGTETILARFLPALSTPPENIVKVSRDFWMPKAAPMTAARTKQPKK
jgi:quinol monooxygenase YgiN